MSSRYKFVAKMFAGMPHVLEVGCADAFGTRVVQQAVTKVTAVDFAPVLVEDARQRMDEHWRFDVRVHDVLSGPVAGAFDAAYALDVIEHIPRAEERRFVSNIVDSLTPEGVLIIGSPSLESQTYASSGRIDGHVNCKTAAGLKELLAVFFHHVFIFSMNDEVVHTGYYPTAQYLFALCCSRRQGAVQGAPHP